MDTLTKVAVVAVIASVAMLGAATYINEQPYIEVHYEDGMPPVDKVYTDATYTIVPVTCPNVVVDVTVVTYEGQEVTTEMREELTEIICGTLTEAEEM